MEEKMNKEEFLRQLEQLLSAISEEERADAVAFYRSYFEDAGEGTEQEVLAKLESPQKAAESILKDFGIDPEKKGADDGKYYNTFANRDEEYYRNINDAVSGMTKRRTKERSAGMVALVVTAAVITSPIWLTLLLLLISLALAAAAMAVGIALASVAVMASLLITGVVLIGAGISLIFGADPAVGIGLIGGGCLVLAIGILALLLVVVVCGSFLPWAVRGIYHLCKKPFEKRKERVGA